MSGRRFRSALFVVAGWLILSDSANTNTESSQVSRPNVLFIVMDTVRADHLSCYGYSKKTSPNLDRLASEGALYEKCITAAPWTLPSLASVFTGLYPRDHHVSSENLKLSPAFPTLAEVLRKSGYQTVGFSCNVWVSEFSGLTRGFDEFFDVWRGLTDSRADSGAESTNEWITDWLDTSRKPERPFFMFAIYFEPHFPYRPPAPYSSKFLPENTAAEQLARLRRWKHPREVGFVLKAPGMGITGEEFDILKSQYDGAINYLDFRIGELVAALKSRNLLDNTILVITSDHGEHFGEHGLMDHKMSLYEEVIHTPLIIRYPSKVPVRTRIQGQVQNVSIFRTILSLTQIELPPGRLAPALPLNDSQAPQPYAFSEFARPKIFLDVMNKSFPTADLTPFDRAMKTVRSDGWKLIWSSDGNHELYDLAVDPGEKINLYKTKAHPASHLSGVLDSYNRGEIP